jgi:hypothetical protein
LQIQQTRIGSSSAVSAFEHTHTLPHQIKLSTSFTIHPFNTPTACESKHKERTKKQSREILSRNKQKKEEDEDHGSFGA